MFKHESLISSNNTEAPYPTVTEKFLLKVFRKVSRKHPQQRATKAVGLQSATLWKLDSVDEIFLQFFKNCLNCYSRNTSRQLFYNNKLWSQAENKKQDLSWKQLRTFSKVLVKLIHTKQEQENILEIIW